MSLKGKLIVLAILALIFMPGAFAHATDGLVSGIETFAHALKIP